MWAGASVHFYFEFLIPAIQQVVGANVTLIDPAPAVAKQVGRSLDRYDLQAPAGGTPQHAFYTTAQPRQLETLLQMLTSTPTPGVEQIRIWSLTAVDR